MGLLTSQKNSQGSSISGHKNHIYGTNMEFKNRLDFKVSQMPSNERTIRGVSKAIQDTVILAVHIPPGTLSTDSATYSLSAHFP